MTTPAPSIDETILALFRERGLLASADLASALGIHERSVRRRLRRLIRDGYVFSPERGRYRITAAGAAVMAPLEARPSLVESSPRDLIDRWRRRPE
ncbi:MAG: winged helix-turn-helix transcriptional regulator [Chloroflexota bacterium]